MSTHAGKLTRASETGDQLATLAVMSKVCVTVCLRRDRREERKSLGARPGGMLSHSTRGQGREREQAATEREREGDRQLAADSGP